MHIVDRHGRPMRDSQDRTFSVKDLADAERVLSFYWDMEYGTQFSVVMDDGNQRTYHYCPECIEQWCDEDGESHTCAGYDDPDVCECFDPEWEWIEQVNNYVCKKCGGETIATLDELDELAAES